MEVYATPQCCVYHALRCTVYCVVSATAKGGVVTVEELGGWIIQLRKGVIELLVLRLLARRGELHGYAIVKELQSIGELVAGESTVYPVLKRLEADSLLISRWVEGGSSPPRKYYQVSDSGEAFLHKANREWGALVESMRSIEEGKNDV
jgi:PadR family transcriptional regulator, regulatory protein PadR